MRRRRDALIRLIATVVVVLGAAIYFLGVNSLPGRIHKGLDLQGGIEIIYQAVGTPHQPYSLSALNDTVQVINLRVNKLGVTEPVVQAEPGSHRILVELAGVKDPEQAQKTIGTTALLQFKDSQGHIIVTGADLKSASAEIQPGQGTTGNVVALQFDAAGRKKLAAFTSANVGKLMPIYIDGKMIMNPVIQQAITTGQAVLTGGFTFPQAQSLAIQLNSGALPLKLNILSKTTVSASLGADSVHASLMAAIVALVLVGAFMLLIYRIPGFWADIALLVYALLLLSVLVGINATLTLPGITGLILSIGMAVDSNVIIYERIKEELRAGRSLKNAVDEGFKNGLRAVLDSNATTIIACVVLYYLGSGLIRGFAVTLGVGVLISLLTAVVFTRYLLQWLVNVGVRPSPWFFAPRAEVALGFAGAGGLSPAAMDLPSADARSSGGRAGVAGAPRRIGRSSMFSNPGDVAGAAVRIDSEVDAAGEADREPGAGPGRAVEADAPHVDVQGSPAPSDGAPRSASPAPVPAAVVAAGGASTRPPRAPLVARDVLAGPTPPVPVDDTRPRTPSKRTRRGQHGRVRKGGR